MTLPPPTIETGLALDPDYPNAPGSVTRDRTYVDGPWPANTIYCCKTFPPCAGYMSKGPKTAVYDIWPDAVYKMVDTDFGKLPGSGPYANEAYLRCRLGDGFDKFDTCRWNEFSGGPPEDCGEEGGHPFDGYTKSKKLQFHNILGGPRRVIIGDDENPLSEPPMEEAAIGEVNSTPGPWVQFTGGADTNLTDPAPAWGPNVWWVIDQLLLDDSRLAVQETTQLAVPTTPVAGPFETEAEAIAAAVPDVQFCVKYEDKDAEGNLVGPPYRQCVPFSDIPLPDPQTDPITLRRIGYSVSNLPLDGTRDNPPAAVDRTVTILRGPWVAASGVGVDATSRCRQVCEPCGPVDVMAVVRRKVETYTAKPKATPATPRSVRVFPTRTPVPAPVHRPPCRHELPVVSWSSCRSEVKSLRGCDVHDLCTRGPNNGTVASCTVCPDYSPPDPPTKADPK